MITNGSNGMYVLDGRQRFSGGPDILQQALREVSAAPEETHHVLQQPPPAPTRPLLLPKGPSEPIFSASPLQPIHFSNRVVYKVIYPEDLDLRHPPAASTQGRRYPRKRGRPRRGEEGRRKPPPPQLRAKNLKEQFGLTQAQIQGLAIYEDEPESVENGDEEEDVGEEEEVHSKKTTRSGRISKPPPHLPGVKSLLKSTSEDNPSDKTLPPPASIPMEKPKRRQFNIPPKYRCRVCNKIYLGNRKMLKHIKLFPSHGPCEEPPKVSSASSNNNLHVPIIPMARNQLEDLVKYLDAELVLDVVSKKMFDNFSLWELVVKKMSSSGRQGIPLMEKLLGEIEAFLTRIKKLFDHCFTATKLGDKKAGLSVSGELTQAALNVGSEGPWYLEDPEHIPSEFHKILGYKNRRRGFGASSDSLEDGNSNLSAGEKDSLSSSPHSLGAQMVLETNLGAVRNIEDEESLDSSPTKKRSRMDDSDEDEEEEIEEEELILGEDVDPKKVLEQNGINISSNSNDETALSEQPDNKVIHVSTSELAMEIESLGPFPPPVGGTAGGNKGAPRLPSFSSIIAEKEDLLSLASSLETPPGKSLPETTVEAILQSRASPLDESKLSTSTNVTFNNQQPIFSLSSASSKAPPPPSANTFLSDLSNVLLSNEADTNDFGFPGSALSSINSLKTPEKLLHSIPPASMMMVSSKKKEERTNFLGALSEGGTTNPSSSSSSTSVDEEEAPSSSSCAPPLYEAPPLISSTLADVTQTASMRIAVDEGPHPHSRDSLSSLFDEVHHDSENIFPPPPS